MVHLHIRLPFNGSKKMAVQPQGPPDSSAKQGATIGATS